VSKSSQIEEARRILSEIRQSPSGMQIGELLESPTCGSTPRRTLVRRLKALVAKGELIQTGGGRSVRYSAAAAPYPTTGPTHSAVLESPEPTWLSPKAIEIRRHLSRPLTERQPVGYQQTFLESYQPNQTPYLRTSDLEQLAEAGEASSTNSPAGTHLRKIMDRLLIDLSWNSSRLEGNTYSLLETQRLLDQGITADGKATQDAQMILNHKAAIEMLADPSDALGFNFYTICNLHALLSENLLPNSAACGRLRSTAAGIGGTVFHPLEVPQRIENYFRMFLEKAGAIQNPFEQAFFAMVHLPYLQPFEDVNKRVSRLAANIPLVRHNLCPISFVDVAQQDYVNGLLGVYELNQVDYLRDVFVWAYLRSAARYSAVRQSLGEPDPFRLRYRTQLGEFIRGVVTAHMDKAQAIRWIASQAELIPQQDRARFIEIVETELGNLHIGNIARFKLMPTDFEAWTDIWSA
jgi:Fic family protein